MSITRRHFLSASVPLGVLARRAAGQPSESSSGDVRFTHGVASGDPLRDAVVLWTRVTPVDPSSPRVSGEWLVARDRDLSDVALSGRFETDAQSDWTVKIDAAGLEADRWYWYGFRASGSSSDVGRTRTLPDGGVELLKIAVFSCANLPFGYFNSYRSAAERDDLDLALHLGDYIYEYGRVGYGAATGRRLGREVEPAHEILTLADYRQRYAQYRGEQELQQIHARLPMIAVWDDHEIANNTWHSGAENHTEPAEGSFADRREAAIRSFMEWMPVRARPGSSRDRIYRSYQLGDLATLIMLDTRLIGRDRQLDYTELPRLDQAAAETLRSDGIEAPDRSMLGAQQEAWLKLELDRSRRRGTPWQILGQQLLVGELRTPKLDDLLDAPADSPRAARLRFMADHSLPLNLDAWDGYGAARERLAQDALSFADNVVVLAGDTHASWAFDLLDGSGRQFGVELGTTSLTSPGLEGSFPPDVLVERLMSVNPLLRFANTKDRGYLVLTLTPAEVIGEWLYVDTVEDRDFTEHLGATARVPAKPGAGTAPVEIL